MKSCSPVIKRKIHHWSLVIVILNCVSILRSWSLILVTMDMKSWSVGLIFFVFFFTYVCTLIMGVLINDVYVCNCILDTLSVSYVLKYLNDYINTGIVVEEYDQLMHRVN